MNSNPLSTLGGRFYSEMDPENPDPDEPDQSKMKIEESSQNTFLNADEINQALTLKERDIRNNPHLPSQGVIGELFRSVICLIDKAHISSIPYLVAMTVSYYNSLSIERNRHKAAIEERANSTLKEIQEMLCNFNRAEGVDVRLKVLAECHLILNANNHPLPFITITKEWPIFLVKAFTTSFINELSPCDRAGFFFQKVIQANFATSCLNKYDFKESRYNEELSHSLLILYKTLVEAFFSIKEEIDEGTYNNLIASLPDALQDYSPLIKVGKLIKFAIYRKEASISDCSYCLAVARDSLLGVELPKIIEEALQKDLLTFINTTGKNINTLSVVDNQTDGKKEELQSVLNSLCGLLNLPAVSIVFEMDTSKDSEIAKNLEEDDSDY